MIKKLSLGFGREKQTKYLVSAEYSKITKYSVSAEYSVSADTETFRSLVSLFWEPFNETIVHESRVLQLLNSEHNLEIQINASFKLISELILVRYQVYLPNNKTSLG